MIGEACLPSKAYVPQTLDYIQFMLGLFLSVKNIPNFAFSYIDFMIFRNTHF